MSSFSPVILFMLCFCTACYAPKKNDARKILKAHHYNFSDFKEVYHQGLKCKIPAYFENKIGKSHVLKEDALSLFNAETSMYFSIERFSEEEVQEILFSFEEGTIPINALTVHYTDLRANSLGNRKVSLREKLRNPQLNGFIQFVSGNYDYYQRGMMYMLATLEKQTKTGKYYYVVQLMVPNDLAPYLADDFRKLCYSIR